jgi:hypothetical protein
MSRSASRSTGRSSTGATLELKGQPRKPRRYGCDLQLRPWRLYTGRPRGLACARARYGAARDGRSAGPRGDTPQTNRRLQTVRCAKSPALTEQGPDRCGTALDVEMPLPRSPRSRAARRSTRWPRMTGARSRTLSVLVRRVALKIRTRWVVASGEGSTRALPWKRPSLRSATSREYPHTAVAAGPNTREACRIVSLVCCVPALTACRRLEHQSTWRS